MRKILDKDILNNYFIKFNIESIFDKNIINYVQLHFYEKEEFILEAETELEYYYFVVDGKVRISYFFENGKSMFLKFYKELNTLGDLELFKNITIRCDVEAVEDTYLLAIPSEVLREKYMSNINFLHHLIDSLSEKLEGTINNSSYNFVYPLVNRLATYLIEHATDKDHIVLTSSFKEIAEFLGTTYRHLSRTIKEFESEDIIKCDNKIIYILEEGKLRELSKNKFIKSI